MQDHTSGASNYSTYSHDLRRNLTKVDDMSSLSRVEASFKGGLRPREKITLTLGVSMGNPAEQGEDLEAFVALVNQHAYYIEKVEVMLTGHIKRHYVGEEKAATLNEDWKRANEKYLVQLKVDWGYTYWEEVITREDYQKGEALVKRLASKEIKDASFEGKLEKDIESHLHLAPNREAAKRYLLEEAAYFAGCQAHLSYPSLSPKSLCDHLAKRYNKTGLILHPYSLEVKDNITQPEPKPQSPFYPSAYGMSYPAPPLGYSPGFFTPSPAPTHHLLLLQMTQTIMVMDQMGVREPEKQLEIFSRFLHQSQEYASNSPAIAIGNIASPASPKSRSLNYGQSQQGN